MGLYVEMEERQKELANKLSAMTAERNHMAHSVVKLQAECEALRDALVNLKNDNGCWCPSVNNKPDTHYGWCVMAHKAVALHRPGY